MINSPSTLPAKRTHAFWRDSFNAIRQQQGSQLLELAIVLPVLLLLLVGAVDFGRVCYVQMEVSAAAEAGAVYGLGNPTDTAGMRTAATLTAPDLAGLTPTASYGSECSDGTGATQTFPAPTCSIGVLQYVEVDTVASYHPILPYTGFASQFTIAGKSRMRAPF